jgi:hypothetical protein
LSSNLIVGFLFFWPLAILYYAVACFGIRYARQRASIVRLTKADALRYGLLPIILAPGGFALAFYPVFVPAWAGVLISLGGMLGLIKTGNWTMILDQSPISPGYWLLINVASILALWATASCSARFSRWFLGKLTGAVEEANSPERG